MSKTRNEIKAIAIGMVERDGLINLSRAGLCEAAGIADGSWFSIMDGTFLELVEELREEGVSSPLRKVNKARTNPALRKEHILETAVAVAKSVGYRNLTLGSVAEAAGVSKGLIARYFSMPQLKNAVMRQAVRHEILEIIAQGLANGNERAKNAPQELKQKATTLLLGA